MRCIAYVVCMETRLTQLRRIIRETISDISRYESDEFVNDPFIAKVIAATHPKELSAAKREYEKADDRGEEVPSAGAFFYWHDKKKEELKSLNVTRPTPAAMRADRILRIRDSTGRATARRR